MSSDCGFLWEHADLFDSFRDSVVKVIPLYSHCNVIETISVSLIINYYFRQELFRQQPLTRWDNTQTGDIVVNIIMHTKAAAWFYASVGFILIYYYYSDEQTKACPQTVEINACASYLIVFWFYWYWWDNVFGVKLIDLITVMLVTFLPSPWLECAIRL